MPVSGAAPIRWRTCSAGLFAPMTPTALHRQSDWLPTQENHIWNHLHLWGWKRMQNRSRQGYGAGLPRQNPLIQRLIA